RPRRVSDRRTAVQPARRSPPLLRAVARVRPQSRRGRPYGGQTFKAEFEAQGIGFDTVLLGKTGLYEALEPRLNAGEGMLVDDPKLREQLMSLSLRSGRIDVRSGEHDDHANAAAGAIWLCRPP